MTYPFLSRSRNALTIVLSVLVTGAVSAQELEVELRSGGALINDVDQAKVAMHEATPYLESSSMVLADIDLAKVDVGEAFKWLKQFGNSGPPDDAALMMRGFVDSLKGAGVSHIYVAASLRSPLDGGPLVIVPCDNPAVVQGLATVLTQRVPKDFPQKVHTGENIVIIGPEVAVKRVTAREGVNRPDLILGLGGDERLEHAVVISIPEEAKEELEAIWPDSFETDELSFPISPRQLVKDVDRLTVSLRLPPEPEMRIDIETSDASAVERVNELIQKAMKTVPGMESMVDITTDINRISLAASPDTFVKLAGIAIAPAQASNRRMQKMNTLKQMGLGMHNYHATHKHFPPRCFVDDNGNPLASWRVAILPFVEQAAMYRALNLDQPWDSEDNRTMTETVIPIFNDLPELGTKTTIRVPYFPGSLWHGDGAPNAIRAVRDGLSNTIGVIDAPVEAAIEWANPEPWVISEDDPMSDIFGDREEVAVGMLDGAAVVLKRSEMTNEKLKAMLTIDGREVIE